MKIVLFLFKAFVRFAAIVVLSILSAIFYENNMPGVQSTYWSEVGCFACALLGLGILFRLDRLFLREARQWKSLLLKCVEKLPRWRLVVSFFAFLGAIGFLENRIDIVQSTSWSQFWSAVCALAGLSVLTSADKWLFRKAFAGLMTPCQNHRVVK